MGKWGSGQSSEEEESLNPALRVCWCWRWHEWGLSESAAAAGIRSCQTEGFDSGNLGHGALVLTFHLWLIGWKV